MLMSCLNEEKGQIQYNILPGVMDGWRDSLICLIIVSTQS